MVMRLHFDPIHLRSGVMNDQAAVIVREGVEGFVDEILDRGQVAAV